MQAESNDDIVTGKHAIMLQIVNHVDSVAHWHQSDLITDIYAA